MAGHIHWRNESYSQCFGFKKGSLGEGIIETVPKLGYRFIAVTEEINDDPDYLVGTFGLRVGKNPGTAGRRDPSGARPGLRYSDRVLAVTLLALSISAGLAIIWIPRLRSERKIHSVLVLRSVLPLDDVEADILSSGVLDAVLQGLRGVSNLEIVSRQTPVLADQVIGASKNFRTDALLLVIVETRGERLTVRLEMRKVRGLDLTWTETVTGRVSQIGWVNSEVDDLVGRHLNAPSIEKGSLAADTAALPHYLRGRYFWNKRNPQALEEAFSSFRAAIKADPKFALAYAGLAQTYAVADLMDLRYQAKVNTYLEGRAAAEKAIALDPSLSSAHAALAQFLRNYDRDMVAAEGEYLTAIKLDPKDGTAHQWYAEFLSFNGRHEEAISEIDRAHELEPLSPVIAAVCGTIRINARRYADAARFNEEALRLDPNYYAVYGNVASVLEGEGHYDEAIGATAREAELAGDSNLARTAREEKAAFARGGVHALMRLRLRNALSNITNQEDASYDIAASYCRLLDREQCLKWLQRAMRVKSETVLTVKNNPAFDSVRDDPRYVSLLKKFGLVTAFEPAGSGALRSP